MAIDIILKADEIELRADGDGANSAGVVQRIVCSTADLELRGGPDRTGGGDKVMRRALVHAPGNLLVVNYEGDYDGVHVQGDLAVFPAAMHLVPKQGQLIDLPVVPGAPGTVEQVKAVDVLYELQLSRYYVQQLLASVVELQGSVASQQAELMELRSKLAVYVVGDQAGTPLDEGLRLKPFGLPSIPSATPKF